MSAELAKADYEMWLESLTQSNILVLDILQADHVDLERLRAAFDEIVVDQSQVESYRPVGSTKYKYDYTPALSEIMKSKRMTPRVLRLLGPDAEPYKRNPGSQPGNNEPRKKIPELEILPFSGDITAFQAFITSFHLKFDDLPISKREKLQHLKCYLRDEPLTIIQPLDLTDENYDLALQELKGKYGNQKHVISQLYHKIEQLPRATNTTASLRSTHSALEGLISALKTFGHNIDDIPPLATRVIMKYPFQLINQLKTSDLSLIHISEPSRPY